MATAGNKLMKEITDQFLHCKICFEPYKDPKTLVCLHTFCSECLQQHVDSDTNRSSRFLLYSRYITCPLCRRKTEIPTGGVRRLPDNFLVSSLTDAIDRKRIGKVPPCEICSNEKPRSSNNACYKCLDCVKLLCKSCVHLHMTTRVTQNHSLIDIEGEKDIECKQHPEEIVRFYCEPCDECICVVCTFQEHRDHEICSFSDGFSKYKSGLDTLLGQCKDRLADVQGRITSINQIESSLKETRENIRDLAISYISQVRSTERQLMQRVDNEYGENVQSFLQNKEWLQENFEGLQATCNLAEIIINRNDGIEMLLLKKDLQNKLSTLLEPGLPPEPGDIAHNIKFVPGNVKLGYISTNTEDESESDGGSVKHLADNDGGQPTKRRCTTRDTQTDTNAQTPTLQSAEMTFTLPPTKPVRSDMCTPHWLDDIEPVNRTDVSVNTMCSMVDSNKQIFQSEDSISVSCVKCSAELKKGRSSSTSSLPVIDGDAPAIQDIIITNMGDGDSDRRQRRRRSLIRSRRVQTDISLSNDENSDISPALSPLRVSSQESLNGSFRKYSSQNLLSAVAEQISTRSIALDPIDFSPETRNKSVNTTHPVKVVPDSRSVKTNTAKPDIRETTTMTFPSVRTSDTQTPDKITVSKNIATDYAGQRNKRTSTPIIFKTDSSTCMPSVTHESKVTWTESAQTTDRSVSTEMAETMECASETMKPSVCEQGIEVKPDMQTVETNTTQDLVDYLLKSTGAEGPVKEKKTKNKEKKEKDKTGDKKKKEERRKKEKKKYSDTSTETDPVFRSDKETATVRLVQKESWTETVSPQLVNTGITPDRPATREANVSTNPVILMDQATHTNVVNVQDNTTETIVVICDSETLTERIGIQDAQTSMDVYSENVETSTDTCYVTETGCVTDNTWLDELDNDASLTVCDVCQARQTCVDSSTSTIPLDTSDRSTLVLSGVTPNILIDCDTQTTPVELYDKSIATSCDFEPDIDAFKGLECSDAATSTENLPYIGLMSDMDCDEIILVPEIAIDVIDTDAEYEKLLSDAYGVTMCDATAQTIVSAATLDIDNMIAQETESGPEVVKPIRHNLVTVGVNTEHKLTFEKETSTPSSHHLSTGTNTVCTSKVDKSTTTESHVRAMQELLGQSPVSERSIKHMKTSKKDVCVETDSTLLDEKMIACINKLKNVSDRLHSPISKVSPDSLPWNRRSDSDSSSDTSILKELDKQTESERRKNVMDLAAKSQAMIKSKDPKTEPVKRKAQPLTTLKGKYREKPTDAEPDKKHSPPSNQKRQPQARRNNSAPGRIATVPNQAALRKTSPKMSPKISTKTTVNKNETYNTFPASKQGQGPEFYSTVPKTRHPKQHALPIITETRPLSTGSTSSSASYRSAVSRQSSSPHDALDLSSLRLKAQPREQSASPTPQRHAARRNGHPATKTKTTVEVIPTIDVVPEERARTGSTSSDQTDGEPHPEKKGFMKKLFGSKKKKSVEKRTSSPSKSPKPGRKAPVASFPAALPEPQAEKPKEKPKAFVYMRNRIFTIQDSDEKFNKPIVNKYCMNNLEPDESPLFDFAATFTKKK